MAFNSLCVFCAGNRGNHSFNGERHPSRPVDCEKDFEVRCRWGPGAQQVLMLWEDERWGPDRNEVGRLRG